MEHWHRCWQSCVAGVRNQSQHPELSASGRRLGVMPFLLAASVSTRASRRFAASLKLRDCRAHTVLESHALLNFKAVRGLAKHAALKSRASSSNP